MNALFAYIGPETTLPVASTIVAATGFLMMLGRASLRFLGKLRRRPG